MVEIAVVAGDAVGSLEEDDLERSLMKINASVCLSYLELGGIVHQLYKIHYTFLYMIMTIQHLYNFHGSISSRGLACISQAQCISTISSGAG